MNTIKVILELLALYTQKLVGGLCALLTISPATFDGLLWIIIGGCTAGLAALSSDDAYKYVEAHTLWNLKFWMGIANGGAMALKTFRSTVYAKHLEEKGTKTTSQTVVVEEKTEPPKTP
jgi:hypothetical protein